MLTTYLTSSLPTKFVLIEGKYFSISVEQTINLLFADTLQERGRNITTYLVKHHSKLKVHYFVFEGSYTKIEQLFSQCNVSVHNLLVNRDVNDFERRILNISNPDVIVIESLSSLLLRFGLADTYRVLHRIVSDKRK